MRKNAPSNHTAAPAAAAASQRISKRKTRRKTAEYRNGHKAKVSPPNVTVPRRWPPEERAQWCKALCECLTDGGSLSAFCREHPAGPARTTWFEWLQEDATFADLYTQARMNGADTLADDCIAIADEVKDAGQFDSARVNAARLRVDARKWVASKLKPKTYADRVETVTSGSMTVQHVISDDDRARALATLLQRQAIAGSASLPDARRLIEAQAIDITPPAASQPAKP